jgi:hypothetical protein
MKKPNPQTKYYHCRCEAGTDGTPLNKGCIIKVEPGERAVILHDLDRPEEAEHGIGRCYKSEPNKKEITEAEALAYAL